jgi:hypothetical protein
MPTSTSLLGRRSQKAWLLWVFALAIFLISACERHANQSVPAHLIGIWKTDDPKYRNLFLEITDRSVIFSTVEGGLETYWIAKTESSAQGKTSAHIIHGERSGENLKFHLYYEATAGSLRFKNQLQMAWSKAAHGRD